MIVSVMFSGVIIYTRKHHRRAARRLYSTQLVACLAHVAVIVSLLRKTFLVTASFQLVLGCAFIHTNYSLFMIKYEYQRISFTACTHLFPSRRDGSNV